MLNYSGSATVPQTTESTIAASTTNVKSQFEVIEPSGRSFTASPSVNRPSAVATNGVKTKVTSPGLVVTRIKVGFS